MGSHKTIETTSNRRARDCVSLTPSQRNRRAQVARWALHTGTPLNLDAATLIISAHPDDEWTTLAVTTFLWDTVREVCARTQADAPKSTAESLYTYLAFLHQHEMLAPGSDRFAQLGLEVRDNGGLSSTGRQQHRFDAPPAGGEVCQLRLRGIHDAV